MISLVERLRREVVTGASTNDDGSVIDTRLINPDGPEAANEIERLREALEKLGRSNAFTVPFFINKKSPEGEELLARMEYAREALSLHKGESTITKGEQNNGSD